MQRNSGRVQKPTIRRKKYDPETAQCSDSLNAVFKYDPETGKHSNAENAVFYAQYYQIKLRRTDSTKNSLRKSTPVDPVTGKKSFANNAIPYQTYKGRERLIVENGDLVSRSTIWKKKLKKQSAQKPVTQNPENSSIQAGPIQDVQPTQLVDSYDLLSTTIITINTQPTPHAPAINTQPNEPALMSIANNPVSFFNTPGLSQKSDQPAYIPRIEHLSVTQQINRPVPLITISSNNPTPPIYTTNSNNKNKNPF